MIINNKSDYELTIIIDKAKYIVDEGRKIEVDLLNDYNEIKIYINRKPNIHFKLFPFFKASHFLEDHIKLNLIFNLSFAVNRECESLEIINCACRCDVPIHLISVALNDYSDVEIVSFFSPTYEKIKSKYLFYEIIFIFLLPLWILGCVLGLVLKDRRVLIFSFICLILSILESVKLIKGVKGLSESEMTVLLKQRAELIELSKQKDPMSQKIVEKIFNWI